MVLVFLCITWTLAIQLTPDPLGIRILGETWEGARDFSLAVGTQTAFTAGSAMAYVALRLVAPLSTLTLSILPAIVLPSMFFAGYFVGGPSGAIWGIACGAAAQAAGALLVYLEDSSRGRGLASYRS